MYCVYDGFFALNYAVFENMLLYITWLKLNMFYKQICELSYTAIWIKTIKSFYQRNDCVTIMLYGSPQKIYIGLFSTCNWMKMWYLLRKPRVMQIQIFLHFGHENCTTIQVVFQPEHVHGSRNERSD